MPHLICRFSGLQTALYFESVNLIVYCKNRSIDKPKWVLYVCHDFMLFALISFVVIDFESYCGSLRFYYIAA